MDLIKLMLIADVHSPELFEMNKLERGEVDLVLTLGDIDPGTIDYILNQASRSDVFGVYGNHDPRRIVGLPALDGKVVRKNSFRISGISGIKRLPGLYQPYHHMYSEGEVSWKLRRAGRVDILVSHAPPYSISQNEDPIHRGFEALDEYIEKYAPLYVIYSHLGKKGRTQARTTQIIGVVGKEYLIAEKE